MSTLHALLGVDVSLRTIVVFLRVRENVHRAQFENSKEGYHRLVKWFKPKLDRLPLRAGVEATSNYHKDLLRYLNEHGFELLVLNPRQVRDLAKGLGVSCKTDKADAEVIARVLEVSNLRCQAKRSKLHDDLRDISRQIQSLTDLRCDIQRRFATPARHQVVKDSDAQLIKFCKAQIKRLESKWLELVKQSPTLQESYHLQIALPRIGVKTARVIVSEFPEACEEATTKKMARYVGVTPCLNESGERRKNAHIQGGNSNLRKAFFMPALQASKNDELCSELYARLRSKGKSHKQALTAVMHKLVRRSAAVHIRHSPWRQNLDLC